PAQPLSIRNRRVRRRRGRQDEQPGISERPNLRSELRPVAEGSAVRLLADERECPRIEVARESAETLGRAHEVTPPEIAGALRRAVRGIRQPDAELEQRELL